MKMVQLSNDDTVKLESMQTALQNSYELNSIADEHLLKLYLSIKDCVLFSEYNYVSLAPSFSLTNGIDKLLLINICISYYFQETSGNDFNQLIIMPLVNNYNHIYVKPETIRDKTIELINPIEIDYEQYPNFSKKYFVTSEKRIDAIRFGKDYPLNQLNLIKNTHFEILNSSMLWQKKKILAVREIEDLIKNAFLFKPF